MKKLLKSIKENGPVRKRAKGPGIITREQLEKWN